LVQKSAESARGSFAGRERQPLLPRRERWPRPSGILQSEASRPPGSAGAASVRESDPPLRPLASDSGVIAVKLTHRPVVLIIRDGWGLNPAGRAGIEREADATLMARTPVNDALRAACPHATLDPGGEAVGLPAGQMGNSEVGHLNLGAGRIVYQSLTRITTSIRDGAFFEIPVLKSLVGTLKSRGGRLHLMGLCSDGGVHSHIDHLYACLELAKRDGLGEVYLHCFMDGRDTSPTAGVGNLKQLEARARQIGVGTIATVMGRYYAMDRDNRWDRVAAAYNAIVSGEGTQRADATASLEEWYAEGKTDEFIPPTVIRSSPAAGEEPLVRDGDGILYYNFRADRARELTQAFMDDAFTGFERKRRPKVEFVCMTEYKDAFHLPMAFPPEPLSNILAEVLAANGLKQLRIAETEKYAHVTFFFNGGVEEPVAGEDRALIPSPKVSTYDLKPEMSAAEVTAELIRRLESQQYDVVICNYANADMVGHTGSIPAAIKAVETVDACVGQVLDVLKRLGGSALVTADHGNAEKMREANGQSYTAHTTFPVEIFYIGPDQAQWKMHSGILADVAPTLLRLLGLPQPTEMTGRSLLEPAAQ
jgi:2,3-bisphosphoglycerate-independent phosphoglycerate mutase